MHQGFVPKGLDEGSAGKSIQDGYEAAGEWIMVESDPEPLVAARRATLRMIEFLAEQWGLSSEHAYLLCSVAMDLRLAQVVNVPMVTVCAALKKSIFEEPARPD